ncbi:serine hydrolase domain-containing protein [Pedobacter arcticus]|uniref:serine hydrolase domain-containing protein n=1 Tax=Pedobacter arcticus TaxID=752140 RepID=UPI0002E6C7CC|nr:serine hydrolase domain-containing protein [Pedobacter arcticus]
MKLKLITSVITILFGFQVFAQNIDVQKIDNFISHIENNNRGIGSVSIFKNGKEVYNKHFGKSNLENVQYNSETKYQIGSITKVITATLIFELIENNKLRLEDKLSKFYPKIPNSDKITIKNLLEHSSGLGDFTAKKDSITWLTIKVSENKIFEEIIKQGVSFQPNEKVAYSNSGYYLLAKITEKLLNKNYATIVAEKITIPLNLKNLTSITEGTKNISPSYSYTHKWEKVTDFEFSNIIGVGDIVSTTNDLNIFLSSLFQYKILKKETIEQMKPDYTKKEPFGRGLMFIPFYERSFYGHGGDTYGTHCMVAYNEQDHLGLAFAINGERFPHNDFAIGILSIIYGKDYEFPAFKSITLKSEDLDEFLGTYSSPNFPLKLTITKEGNILKGQATGQPKFSLEAYETTKFKLDQAGLKLEFLPEEKEMILNQNGKKVKMRKE